MENASKALLIAAAVLIVIILVAFGMKVLNSTKGTKTSATTTGKAISAAIFNAKFKPYIGANKTKNEIIKLVDIVNKNNSEKDVIILQSDPKIISIITKQDLETRSKGNGNIARFIAEETWGNNLPNNIYEFYDKDGYIRVLVVIQRKNYTADYDKNLKPEKGW